MTCEKNIYYFIIIIILNILNVSIYIFLYAIFLH